MTELEQYKAKQKLNRIKQVRIGSAIGGALAGYLYSKGIFLQHNPKTPTKEKMIFYIVIGTLIGSTIGYLGAKKIENEK